jgi:sensor histidine kinase YesM
MKERTKFICQSWIKTNIIYSVVGIAVGIIICLFMTAAKGELVDARRASFQILFSLMISLGVTNSIFLAQTLFRVHHERWLSFLFIYYSFSIIGMIAGIELSHFIISILFDRPYTFFHIQDVYFSTLIVLIICTINYTYNAQKDRLNSRLKEKELDMMRLKQMKTQAELAALHSKINPHFLYNSLNSIASLIHDNPDKAESMTLKLSRLFRYSINQNQEHLVKVKEEVEIVNTYLDIEKVRFGNRINFTFNVDDSLLECKIPRFLIQPLVENALKHGLSQVAENGKLYIGIHKVDQAIEIIIADSGKPFPEELQTGYGLQSTYDKLDLLFAERYNVQINNEPRKQIKINIPLEYEHELENHNS